jgi:hypothetical protein
LIAVDDVDFVSSDFLRLLGIRDVQDLDAGSQFNAIVMAQHLRPPRIVDVDDVHPAGPRRHIGNAVGESVFTY